MFVHLVFALTIFALSFTSDASSGLPILVIIVDYPASLLAQWLCELTPVGTHLHTSIAIQISVYTLIGSAWFYLIGVVLRTVIQKLFRLTQPGKQPTTSVIKDVGQ